MKPRPEWWLEQSQGLAERVDDPLVQAAEALWRISEPAVEPLIAALGDADSSVRRAATEGLDRLKWQPNSCEVEVSYWIVEGIMIAIPANRIVRIRYNAIRRGESAELAVVPACFVIV